MFHGKKYIDSVKNYDKTKQYETSEALDVVINSAKAKFDETVEVHVKLGVDSRHADQQVRGAIVLPNGTGKSVRVLVFAKGDKAEAAAAAGAAVSFSSSTTSSSLSLVAAVAEPSPCSGAAAGAAASAPALLAFG